MAGNFKEDMKKSLLALKMDILSKLSSDSDSFHSLSSDVDPKDDADVAAEITDKKMLESMNAQDVTRLNLIDAALSRIQADRYGLCMKCGKKIPEARLRALPYAVLCIDCKCADECNSR